MKILVVGGGGREHALIWKIARSPLAESIICAPGNAGIAELAECVPVSAEDVDGLLALARRRSADLVVIGPEAPLTMGLADSLAEAGIKVFGPSAKAARIEGSKAFAKKLMQNYGIPTAAFAVFDDPRAAREYVRKQNGPLVIKADGLAAGKGVILCQDTREALAAVDRVMIERAFGEAGDRVLIEELLVGEEASYIVFTDGKTIRPLPSSQDHKAAFDGDRGPNTGGMGAYSPAPVITPELEKEILQRVMEPAINGMAAEGCPFRGVLYAGLMIGEQGPKVLEFNARFGDPETQPLMMRLKSDLVPILEAVADGTLDNVTPEWDERATVTVVMAAGGYPESYRKGDVIEGLEDAAALENVVVFHAGTKPDNGRTVTAGGRVLGVTALGADVARAIERAYQAVELISFDGVHFRRDIGKKAMDRGASFVMQEKGFTMYDPSSVPTIRGQTSLTAKGRPVVGIVMGSDSDADAMSGAVEVLRTFGLGFEVIVASAHRTPQRVTDYATSARERGIRVLIAGAGWAAHLAGVIAAQTTLPVIGVPLESSPLSGLDSLLSTVQMPPGVPVATVALGKGGAKNAAHLAVRILALTDPSLAARLDAQARIMAEEVEEKSKRIAARFSS